MPHRKKSGFTLIELLIVITIVALLVAMLLPALGKANGLAKQLKCMANVRQMTSLAHVYSVDYRGAGPIYTSITLADVPTWGGQTGAAGAVYYLTRQGLLSSQGPHNSVPSLRLCPELSPSKPSQPAGSTANNYSQYSFNYEVTGYFRSFANGTMRWATPGYNASLAPTRLGDIASPNRVYVVADAMFTKPDNTVYSYSNESAYTAGLMNANRHRLGANISVSGQFPSVSNLVNQRHSDDRVNFAFADGHGETRRYVASDALIFGEIAEGEYLSHTPP